MKLYFVYSHARSVVERCELKISNTENMVIVNKNIMGIIQSIGRFLSY